MAPATIDREKTCPFLVRVFIRQGTHPDIDRDFTVDRVPVADEAQVYTWKDATLREICLNLIDSTPSLKSGYARFSFRLVYFDTARSRYSSKDLGVVFARDLSISLDSANPKGGGLRTLDECRFVVGDFLSLAVLTGSAGAPPPPGAGTGAGAGAAWPPSRSAPGGFGGNAGARGPPGPAFGIRGRGGPQFGAPEPRDRDRDRGDRRTSETTTNRAPDPRAAPAVHPSRLGLVGRGATSGGAGSGVDAERWARNTDRQANGGGGDSSRRRDSRSRSPPRRPSAVREPAREWGRREEREDPSRRKLRGW